MKFSLLNDDEFFSMKISNVEGNVRTTPSRAFKKVNSVYDKSYFTEVLTAIKHDNLIGQKNYSSFNNSIDQKIKNKETKDNINIISFFGDKQTDISEISKFEDIGLIDNFEKLFNDHLISTPYSLSLYNKDNFDSILPQVKDSFDNFATSLNTKNIFCYIPAYINYKQLDDFIKFYSGKNLGTVFYSGGTFNAIPLYIDFKRSNPDTFKRSVAMLYRLKQKYIKEGFYPVYYAANVSKPRLSSKKNTTIAKEFMLSFLGFDIIGSSLAFQPREGPIGYTPINKYIDFDLSTFNYFYKNENNIKNKEANNKKAEIFSKQTDYLSKIHDKNNLKKELSTRPEAKKYIKTYE